MAEKSKKNKGGRPTRFSSKVGEISAKLCRMGATDELLAEVFGVTPQTIGNWKNKHPEFFETIKKAKNEADAKVERSLFELACGFDYTAQKPMTLSDGKDLGSHIELVDYREHVIQNPTAIIFWLKNRQPEKWRDKQINELTGPNGSDLIKPQDYSNMSEEEAQAKFEELLSKQNDELKK